MIRTLISLTMLIPLWLLGKQTIIHAGTILDGKSQKASFKKC